MSHAFPSTLDELPVHQAPLPVARPATSGRNSYDRCYLTVRLGDRQHTLRVSDALGQRTTEHQVGPLRVEVVEPLERLRLVCDHPQLRAELTWTVGGDDPMGLADFLSAAP